MYNYLALLVMAGVTYLVRALPFALIQRKIRSRFLKSFLAYIPATVLAAMTIPDIFRATSEPLYGAAALLVGTVMAYRRFGLFAVAAGACAAVLLARAAAGLA